MNSTETQSTCKARIQSDSNLDKERNQKFANLMPLYYENIIFCKALFPDHHTKIQIYMKRKSKENLWFNPYCTQTLFCMASTHVVYFYSQVEPFKVKRRSSHRPTNHVLTNHHLHISSRKVEQLSTSRIFAYHAKLWNNFLVNRFYFRIQPKCIHDT